MLAIAFQEARHCERELPLCSEFSSEFLYIELILWDFDLLLLVCMIAFSIPQWSISFLWDMWRVRFSGRSMLVLYFLVIFMLRRTHEIMSRSLKGGLKPLLCS